MFLKWFMAYRRMEHLGNVLRCTILLLICVNGPLLLATDSPVAEAKPYTETIAGTDVTFRMVPIPGGEFSMGSPDSEVGRKADEGPRHRVKIEPFWMGATEVTWDEYDVWTYNLDIQRRKISGTPPSEKDQKADLAMRPTRPYTDMSFGMGQIGCPAVCMTQHAAKAYCEWLSAKTGHYYRLPTEAEWEYACRAGTATPYSFGNDVSKLGEYAWFYGNSGEKYHKVGQKKPNPWGLFDMHGNVAEWCIDKYDSDYYATSKQGHMPSCPVNVPSTEFPRVVRGGSWDDDAEVLRSASRIPSTERWKARDPNLPHSIWYTTDSQHVGFRIVRPLKTPSKEERVAKTYDAILPANVCENPIRVPDYGK